MADQNSGPLDISLDLTKKSTLTPMVADGHLARWRLANLSQSRNEKGPYLKLEWDLQAPAPNTEGGQIEPGKMGSKFFQNIMLYDKNTPAGQVPERVQVQIAQLLDALLGTGDPDNKKGKPTRPVFNAETGASLLGKELVSKMKVRSGDYVGNEFGQVYFPGDIAA
jgi:hypothetical protein